MDKSELRRLRQAGRHVFARLRLHGARLNGADLHDSAFLGGVFFMLGGSSMWFVGLQLLSNPSMTIPVVLYAAELAVSRRTLAASVPLDKLIAVSNDAMATLNTSFTGSGLPNTIASPAPSLSGMPLQ